MPSSIFVHAFFPTPPSVMHASLDLFSRLARTFLRILHVSFTSSYHLITLFTQTSYLFHASFCHSLRVLWTHCTPPSSFRYSSFEYISRLFHSFLSFFPCILRGSLSSPSDVFTTPSYLLLTPLTASFRLLISSSHFSLLRRYSFMLSSLLPASFEDSSCHLRSLLMPCLSVSRHAFFDLYLPTSSAFLCWSIFSVSFKLSSRFLRIFFPLLSKLPLFSFVLSLRLLRALFRLF